MLIKLSAFMHWEITLQDGSAHVNVDVKSFTDAFIEMI